MVWLVAGPPGECRQGGAGGRDCGAPGQVLPGPGPGPAPPPSTAGPPGRAAAPRGRRGTRTPPARLPCTPTSYCQLAAPSLSALLCSQDCLCAVRRPEAGQTAGLLVELLRCELGRGPDPAHRHHRHQQPHSHHLCNTRDTGVFISHGTAQRKYVSGLWSTHLNIDNSNPVENTSY